MAVKSLPQRLCVGCREFINKKQLIRIVKSPEGEISLDPSGKKPGRGAYICPNHECFKKAIKNKSLEKSLKTKINESVYEDISNKITSYTKMVK